LSLGPPIGLRHGRVRISPDLCERRPRAAAEAKVSIFDAGFALGDGGWEGLRLHQGALPARGKPQPGWSGFGSASKKRPPEGGLSRV